MYKNFFKRAIDIIFSGILLILLSLFFLFLYIVAAIKMKGSPMFTQLRPGKNGRSFKLHKFRTMTNAKIGGELLPDADRLTKFGKFMRRTSLDELPELWDIFRGKMSFIGPRPLLTEYLPLYNRRQLQRQAVRPGLTGLAQVNGRNAIGWQKKFDLDILYVDKLSFWSDVKIMCKTVFKVFKKEGINQAGEATMEKFSGNETTNILILSSGRRVELVNCFKKAREKLKVRGKIICADMSLDAPSLYFADEFVMLAKIEDGGGYIQNLIDICNENNIDLVVPTIDTELKILSENKKLLQEKTRATILVSNKECIDICRDKYKTVAFLKKNGFAYPKTYDVKNISECVIKYPLFIKPADGSSAINAFKINDYEELSFFCKYIKNPIIQELVNGTEYTIDVFCDFDGNVISCVPRVRIAVRSGEILKGRIVKNKKIMLEVALMVKKLNAIGHITVQGFLDDLNDTMSYIEINARFGGGAPMSITAGADSCEYLYRILNGEKLEYNENFRDNLLISRFDSSIIIGDKND